MSKNSLRSFLSRENRREEVKVFKLELQVIFVINKNSNLKRMLHNLALQAYKPQNLSLIKILHLLLSYYPFDSSFIRDNFPLMAQRHHCHLHKASFMQSQLALSFALFPFAQASSTKSDKLF